MGQAEESILQVCQLIEVKETKDREKYPNHFRYLSVRPFYRKTLEVNVSIRMAGRQYGFTEQAQLFHSPYDVMLCP